LNARQDEPVRRRIVACQDALLQTVRREAGAALLRFEGADDLVQGISCEALRAAGALELRGEEEFRAWLWTIARRHLGERRRYWFSLKRDGGRALRLTTGGEDGRSTPVIDSGTGPFTFASRRENLLLATRALALLLPRDQELIRWSSEGLDVADIAGRLDISPAAAERARSRALERLRKAYLVVSRR